PQPERRERYEGLEVESQRLDQRDVLLGDGGAYLPDNLVPRGVGDAGKVYLVRSEASCRQHLCPYPGVLAKGETLVVQRLHLHLLRPHDEPYELGVRDRQIAHRRGGRAFLERPG